MGIQILAKSFRQVWQNRTVALRISLVWYGLYFALGYVSSMIDDKRIAAIPNLLFLITFFFGFSKIAVGWHRYVLRQDEPKKPVILERLWPVSDYVKMVLVLCLIIFLPMTWLVAVPFGALADYGIGTDDLFRLLLGIVAIWFFLRLGLVLPAIAVEEKLSFRESFGLTRTVAGPLFVTSALIMIMLSIPDLLFWPFTLFDETSALYATFDVLFLPVDLVVIWINWMVCIGVLTVLYGHLYEKRPL